MNRGRVCDLVVSQRELRFRRHPLVVLQEQCAAQPLSTHYANFQGNLHEFWETECKLTTRIAILADRAHFFKKDNVAEYDSVFPKLNEQDAKSFGWWVMRLKRLATAFTGFQDSLMRRREDYTKKYSFPDTQDLCSGSGDEGDSVLPPTQVSDYKVLDSNDLCSNLENFIERLKEIQKLDSALCVDRKIVYRNYYAVVYHPPAKYKLGDRLSDIVQE
ncbi:MAG: hypothetical protein OXC30_00445 [Alphaproteobacteria bacterium]|nr:hypothetical protein [Alphaproteobacteria bacterium]